SPGAGLGVRGPGRLPRKGAGRTDGRAGGIRAQPATGGTRRGPLPRPPPRPSTSASSSGAGAWSVSPMPPRRVSLHDVLDLLPRDDESARPRAVADRHQEPVGAGPVAGEVRDLLEQLVLAYDPDLGLLA